MKKFFDSLSKLDAINKETHFAVSVSGGVDSNTLLFLLYSWSKKFDKKLTVLYFDHNLRKDSKKDFLVVKKICSKFELKCVLLQWNKKPASAILEKARIARYQAISRYCSSNNIYSLFTGHHADDIAETVAMRILSQSNIDGLCPIIKQRSLFGIKLIRPMLNFRKSEIYEYAKEKKINFIEDPSNKNTKTLRARVRYFLNSDNQLTENLIKSSSLFCKLKNITENYIKNTFHQYYNFYDTGYIEIEKKILSNFPKYMLYKFLKICLTRIGNKPYPPKSKTLEKLVNLLYSDKKTNFTLSGCIISTKRKNIYIMREYNNVEKNVLEISKDTEMDWDNRFNIRNLSKSNKIGVFPLGEIISSEKFKKLSNYNKKSFNNLPYMVKICLPVIKSLEGSVLIPHLNIYNGIDLTKNVSIKKNFLY